MKKMQLLLSLGSIILSHSVLAQSSQEETLKPQKEALVKQETLHEKQLGKAKLQKEALIKQETLHEKQLEKANLQKEVMDALKQEMIKDGLIQKGRKYTLLINNKEMLVNDKKQTDSMHQKYIDLINKKRKTAFGDKEEWKIQE